MLLVQKKPEPSPKTINDATRLFSGLADLDFEPGYNDHVYFQYLSNNKNDISLLGAYHPEEIYSKYIVQVSEKDFTVIDHPSEIYGLPNTHECIDGNLPLCLHWSKSILSGTYRVPDIYSYIPTYRIQIGLLYMYSTYQVPNILS